MNGSSRPPWTRWPVLWGTLAWTLWVFYHYFPLPAALDLSFLAVVPGDLRSLQGEKCLGTWLWFVKDLLGAALWVGILYRSGVRVARWLGLGPDPGPSAFWVPTALGMTALGSLWTALGLNGLWQEGFLKGCLVGLSLWMILDLRGEERTIPIGREGRPGEGKGYFLLGAPFAGLALLLAAAPDVFYDGLVYHLSTLRFWLDRHAIADLPTNLYTYYPFGGEMALLNGFLLGGSEGAKCFNVLGFLFLGGVAWAWVREEAGAWAGALAWAMVLSIPFFNATVWTSQVDILLALFFLLFVFSLSRALQGKGPGWAWAAGIFAGSTLSVKYTAGLGILLALGIMGILGPRGRTSKGTWIAMGTTAVAVFSPWVLRNIVLCANPVYPYPFLGLGRSLPPGNLAGLLADHEAVWGVDPSFGDWFRRLLTRDLDKTMAPLLLGLLPFLFRSGLSGIARSLMVLGGLWALLGHGLSHQPRLAIPAFTILLVAMGMGLGRVEEPWKRKGAAWVILAFASLSFLSLGRLAVHYYRVDKVWFGVESRSEYLAASPQTASYYPLTRKAGELVPPGKRLLVVGDARGLYYPGPVVTHSLFDPQVPEGWGTGGMDALRRRLREMGVDGWVVSGTEGARLFGDRFPYSADGAESADWKAFRKRWLRPLYHDGKNAIYLLSDGPIP